MYHGSIELLCYCNYFSKADINYQAQFNFFFFIELLNREPASPPFVEGRRVRDLWTFYWENFYD